MIVDYDIVLNTYYNIRGNIRNKKKVIRFEILLNSNINYLVDSINNNTYKLIFLLFMKRNIELFLVIIYLIKYIIIQLVI